MRKLALLCVLAVVAVASADELAVTDFYNNGLVGGSQYMDMMTNSGCTVATGITAASWSTGSDLTNQGGSPASHSIWADGWDNEDPNDYIKLEVQLGGGYYMNFDELRYATRASSTGPATANVEIFFDGVSVWSTSYAETGSYVNRLEAVDLTTDYGDLVEIYWTGTGATGNTGSWRVCNYYDSGYYDDGILGTIVPEPTSMLLLGLAGLFIRRR